MPSVRNPRLVAFALAVLVGLVPACTDKKKPTPPDPEAGLRAARARLAVLAQATANGVYDATYRFVQEESNATGTIRIRQRPPQYRIDINSKDSASFFSLKTGTVSCSARKSKRSCFLVARPGEEVPALFDPGVQRLFRDAVQDLATHPNTYLVTAIPPSPSPSATPSPGALPVGECFQVQRIKASTGPDQPAGFEDGTYCFAERGIATRIEVASGRLILRDVGGAPTAKAFKPTAKVVKLPNLSPTPTPSKSK